MNDAAFDALEDTMDDERYRTLKGARENLIAHLTAAHENLVAAGADARDAANCDAVVGGVLVPFERHDVCAELAQAARLVRNAMRAAEVGMEHLSGHEQL